MLPILKEKLLAKGAVVNCDETWCRVKVAGRYGKKLYLKDGRYCIDNSLAERTLRPMTVERKNSLGFGSHAGVEISVIYHTFIETCKMCGVSTLEYFKEFFKAAIKRVQFRILSRNAKREQARIKFRAVMQGRTDYENLLPMTIGIKK